MLAELMGKNGIKKACIVDDANDRIPVHKDMTSLAGEWDDFWDDMPQNEDLLHAISKKRAGFNLEKFSMDDVDDRFVETLWELKDDFPEELSGLFLSYESTKQSDLEYVQTLKSALEENTFEVTTVGRDFESVASSSDIIFIDLFLHLDQTKDNIEYSTEILKNIITHRADSPPIIILVSRSSRLSDYAEYFREECGIIESGFRIYKKVDLSNKNKLIFNIKKLIESYQDSIKVWKFFNAWEEHANNAVRNTVSSLKKLDLLDHNMIHNFLLNEEGQSSASYFMDLFDSILLHNFESQAKIIDTAITLNDIDFSSPPTIQGLQKEPLQDLVFKSAFMGAERCRLNEVDSIELGDVFKLSTHNDQVEGLLQEEPNVESVWLVITPSCDLIRCGIKNIGLIKGVVKQVNHDNWITDTKASTPIIKINSTAYSVKWDIKSFMTYPMENFQQLINDQVYFRVAKMREVNALGFQQSFTSDYGRIGQRGILPSVFKTPIELAYLDSNGNLVKLPSEHESQGTCYVGTKKNKDSKIVNFSLPDHENILHALSHMDINSVNGHAKSNIRKLKENPYILIEALGNGVELSKKNLTDIKDNSNPIAKIIFGEPEETNLKPLRSVGLLFIVSSPHEE